MKISTATMAQQRTLQMAFSPTAGAISIQEQRKHTRIELIRRKQLIVEINTRGIYKGRCPDYYPSDYALAQVAKYNIPMVVSTDAHKSEELAEGRDAAIDHLKSLGIKFLMYRKNNQWEEYAIV